MNTFVSFAGCTYECNEKRQYVRTYYECGCTYNETSTRSKFLRSVTEFFAFINKTSLVETNVYNHSFGWNFSG